MNVLVTGAQGFLGSWLAERLLDEGRTVVALRRDVDPESRFRREGIEDRCTVALADLTNHDALVRVLNEHEVAEVFHVGAQTIVDRLKKYQNRFGARYEPAPSLLTRAKHGHKFYSS